MEVAARDVSGPDRATQWLIVVIAEVAAIVLLVLHEGIDRTWPGFADQGLRMLLYTLAIAPPLMLALMIERLAERFSYLAIGLLALLLTGVALHTGNDCLPGLRGCNSVSFPYWLSLTVALFVLLPFLQTWRDAGTRLPIGLPYSGLYHHAWDNALALAATAAFVGAAWAVLWLWGALFALIGIPEFRELFDKPRFVYPVTGLIAGFGLVMSRAQGGALRAVLRLCLSLARALLPFVMLLALLFLAVVTLRGVDTLWQTHRAASLLLWLVLFGVVLANGVYQDGGAEARYPRWLRNFVSAGLLSLPAHAALASWAIALRVEQYGWTPERLSAALVAVILGLHALLLASAVFPSRDGRWLARLSVSNPLLAGVVVVLLLASQSPLLDFRAITVDSQLERLERGEVILAAASPREATSEIVLEQPGRVGVPDLGCCTDSKNTPDSFDIGMFARELGTSGRAALKRLKADPRHAGDARLVAKIEEALSGPSAASLKPRTLSAADIDVMPAGNAMPDGLFESLAADFAPAADWKRSGIDPDCRHVLRPCLLLEIDLGGPEGSEWLFVPSDTAYLLPPLVYGRSVEGRWQLMASVGNRYDNPPALNASFLIKHPPSTAVTRWSEFQAGEHRYSIIDGRPKVLDLRAEPAETGP